jgi:hypothetical protein
MYEASTDFVGGISDFWLKLKIEVKVTSYSYGSAAYQCRLEGPTLGSVLGCFAKQ